MARLDSRYTFENFVVGPANRLASAAARRAAERPGVSYNPLFIHAPEGLGKTHLLGAIAKHAQTVHPEKAVEYQTAQDFLRGDGLTPGPGDEAEVRLRYRAIDILLLDDIHLFVSKADVQPFLFLTLDAFTAERKQVVFACDRPPAAIEGLDPHLRARFENGLLVEIGRPEYETRVAIVNKRLDMRFQLLEPGVADAIGRFPVQAVSQLEKAVDRILGFQDREDRMVSPEEAKVILEGSDSSEFELDEFLVDLSDTVAAKVEAQETPWRKDLRETAEEAEARGFKAAGLRRLVEEQTQPEDLAGILKAFHGSIQRLEEIGARIEAVGNPWPEAARGVLRDPDRLEEAEALLLSAEELARPFPEIIPGPTLTEFGGQLPQLVIRAADQLVSTDRPEYNPLFVWSPDGLAARALLQAAGRSKLLADENARVAWIAVPNFAGEFVHALSVGVAGAWRERWWLADLLLIDKAQELSTTERAQEELFHLFEALRRRKARVMIAADRPPAEIPALDERLRARLEAGLVVEVEVEGSDLSQELQVALRDTSPAQEFQELVDPEESDVVVEDREWIKSIFPGAGSSAGSATQGKGGAYSESGLGADASARGESWIPSPEQVLWVWPNLEDRLVEEPD